MRPPILAAWFMLAATTLTVSAQVTSVDLSTYVRVGRYDLPEPTRTAAPNSTNLLAQEVSGVTYNWDTETLFVVGDGGTAVVQVSKTGALIDTMTLASGGSPQGTEFYDPEGITYIGGGQFVITEERDRRLVKFTYAAGTVLTRGNTQNVTLGTFVPNEGTEGLSYDPLTGGFICLKEINPQGIFQTAVDFVAGTASNGSATTVNSTNLFDPAWLNLLDLADVFALANVPSLTNHAHFTNLLVLSQVSAKIVNVDRAGNVASSLTIVSDPGNPLTVAAQQHEGLTMDYAGNLYVVSENGGGDFDHPQLWVYAPSALPNQAPTAVTLTNTVTSIAENTSTATPLKVADLIVADDGLGTNVLTVTGTDAAFFEITGTALFIKAGTVLDYETKTSYSVTVNVDDASVGSTPDATAAYALTVTDVIVETSPAASLIISEVAPWSSGNSPVGADWFEVSNTGTNVVNLTGWKVDDSSAAFASAAALNGITNIAPGESVIFIETADLAGRSAAFRSNWFGANPPAGLQIGSYSGAGLGLSTGGDGVNLFDSSGTPRASVSFGASPTGTFPTFDNAAGLNASISRLSVVRVFGAFKAANNPAEIGSPGTIGRLIISEVAPWSSGSSPVGADWFEVVNTSARTVDLTGWKVDDSSANFGLSAALNGITNLAPGEAVIFLETTNLAAARTAFLSNWFGASPPANLQIGSYTGVGLGLSTGGDAVNLFDSLGAVRASVSFGASPAGPAFPSFDNGFGLNNTAISELSTVGVRGAFVAAHAANETGSPGTTGKLIITEVAPWSSGSSPVGADWFEVSNTGSTPVDLTGWKVDDSSQSPAAAVPLSGITNLAPGESVIFIESTNLAGAKAAFLSNWFGASPPAGLQIGTYSGAGIGLSTGGDAVNLYDNNGVGVLQASLSFGAAPAGPAFPTFDNGAGLNSATVAQLSSVGLNGAFNAVNSANETGSPGLMTVPGLTITRTGSDAILRWSVDSTGYRLEDAPALAIPTSWSAVAHSVVLTNGQNTVTVPLTIDFRYYRLRKP